ncbi:hypothetical protein BC829DRAFT_425189 [Chytridium lagenaria]|nr:hypothetical protein BC829DRAFT_425189 [Chytridium lagenaria]
MAYFDNSLWLDVIDVHAHIIDSPGSLSKLDSLKLNRICIMGTRVEDWEVLEELAETSSKAIIAFGIHPWFAHQVSMEAEFSDAELPRWLRKLESLLLAKPTTFVGEIGLDGIATYPNSNIKYDMDHQLLIYAAQFDLAARLQRCVSVHAVQCFGKVLDFFRERVKRFPKKSRRRKTGDDHLNEEENELEKWPRAIMLHSFSGSLDFLQAILRFPPPIAQRFYFSFSYVVNSRSMEKTLEKIKTIPDDRVLIESDLHDSLLVEDACIQACQMVASAKGWTLFETIQRTGANARQFLQSK